MFKLEIKTGGAAFCDPCTGEASELNECMEVSRILREIADKIECGSREGKCMDFNGNGVGTYGF